jgi:hypothetical protein
MVVPPALQCTLLWLSYLWIVSCVPRPLEAFSTPQQSQSWVVIQRSSSSSSWSSLSSTSLPRSIIVTRLAATLDDDTTTTTTTITPVHLEEGNPIVKAAVLAAWEENKDDELCEQEQIIMDVPQGFYALSRALKSSGIVMGLKGSPFVLRSQELISSSSSSGTTTTTDNDTSSRDSFGHFFTMKDLAKALEDDFLDAAKGSTDNRKGWKVRPWRRQRRRRMEIFSFFLLAATQYEVVTHSLTRLYGHFRSFRLQQYPTHEGIPLRRLA